MTPAATDGSSRAARLMDILGLSEDELCRTLDADPLTLLSGQLEHRPELPILLTMLDEAQESADASVLRRWVRVRGERGRPLDALVTRDFAVFEDALAEFAQGGFELRLRAGGGSRDAGERQGEDRSEGRSEGRSEVRGGGGDHDG
jgi:hypothetical protein